MRYRNFYEIFQIQENVKTRKDGFTYENRQASLWRSIL